MAEDAAKVGEDHGANERSTEGSSTLIEQVSVCISVCFILFCYRLGIDAGVRVQSELTCIDA
jgi:hypothetical protein